MNSISSNKLFDRLLVQQDENPRLVIITGPSGFGKTTWCMQLREHAGQRKMKVGGVISPAVFKGGQKTGIDLVNIQTGENRHLAVRGEKKHGWLELGTWSMDPHVLEWGNTLLASIRDCQVVIIDEIGPLEFEQHAGLLAAFNLVETRGYDLACISLRPSLLAAGLKKWPWAEVVTLADPQKPG